MTTSKSQPARVDPEWCKEAKAIMNIRLTKGLARFKFDEIGTAEFTRLMRRTENYPKVLEELKTKPKRR